MISGDYFPAELPEAAAKKVPKISAKSAEEQSAPASLTVCSVEADAPDKFCSGKLAGERQAPAEPHVLAVEANVLAAADLPLAKKVPKINAKSTEGQSAPASPRVCSVVADAPDKFCSGKLAGERQAPAEPRVLAVEADAPAAADVPLVLVVEPQAPAWAQQIVRFL